MTKVAMIRKGGQVFSYNEFIEEFKKALKGYIDNPVRNCLMLVEFEDGETRYFYHPAQDVLDLLGLLEVVKHDLVKAYVNENSEE